MDANSTETLDAKEEERKRFLTLCDRLQSTQDAHEREELKRIVADLVFGAQDSAD